MRVRVVLPLVVASALAAPAGASAAFIHTVMPGESLSSIAAADGLTVAQLAAANGISPDTQLVTGGAVAIPAQTSSGLAMPVSSATPGSSGSGAVSGDGDGDSDDVVDEGDSGVSTAAVPTASAAAASTSSSSGSYVVQPGDTLTGIAARAGTTVAGLAAANGLDPAAVLTSGTVLRLSGLPSAATASGTATPVSNVVTLPQQPVGTAAQGDPTAPPYPTPERLTAGQVGSIGAAQGVAPSLAAAIAWQESGFNNDLVSSADARGIMQILPGTWAWIQHELVAGASPLAPASATDNVRGGSLLLRWLLNNTGGDPAMAAAGYYQGLSSVQRYGMFPDTRAYVQSVMALRSRFGG